jgi:acyl-CoA synthetase (AMP-forming)/AMP-acid ligase II
MQIAQFVRRAARYYGDAPCLVQGDRTLSFREFDAATDALGNALLALGLGRGDRVAVALPNSIECLVAYYALAKAGLVRVPLNQRETAADHAYKIADSGSRCVIASDLPDIEAEIVIDKEQLASLIAEGDPRPCRVDRGLEEPLRLGYTGGTTGKPKAVTLTTSGELCEITAFLTDLVPDLHPGDTFLHASPIAHASGSFFLPSLVRGVRSVIMPKFDSAAFIELAARIAPSHTFLVPTMLAMIVHDPALAGVDLPFRRIMYGASPIAPALLERAQARFGRVFAQTYGQAESPMVITYLGPEDHDRVGSCGRPYTMVDVRVVDENEVEVEPGRQGEIVCRGPQTMARYWNRPEETEKVFRGGWLHTGDIGTMDEDGFFYLVDRKNDMLISGGFNVYPREVEDVLLSCEGVHEAAVIGLPDITWGDRVHAVVAGAPGLDPAVVLAYAQTKLAGYKRPKAVEVWDVLPKSPANKILRREVRAKVLERLESSTAEARA